MRSVHSVTIYFGELPVSTSNFERATLELASSWQETQAYPGLHYKPWKTDVTLFKVTFFAA